MKPIKNELVKDKSLAAAKLFQAVSSLKTPAEAKCFFEDLCTPAELQAMVDRWEVVPLLKAGIAYQKIYEMTGVSVTTIGRVARALRFGTGAYDLIFTRLEQNSEI